MNKTTILVLTVHNAKTNKFSVIVQDENHNVLRQPRESFDTPEQAAEFEQRLYAAVHEYINREGKLPDFKEFFAADHHNTPGGVPNYLQPFQGIDQSLN